MVTARHEVLHRLFQERPEVVVPALRLVNLYLPEDAAVEELSPDCTEVEPVERRADTVLHVRPPGSDRFVLVVESQGRRDPGKRYSWACYLAFLMAKHGCPAQLLVLCSDSATAKWAQGPFRLGLEGCESLTVSPWVLGPDNVPVVADPVQAARDLPLAALSAVLHRADASLGAILEALARALTGVTDEAAVRHYLFMIDAGLDAPARETWRNLVSAYFPGGGPLLQEREREIRAEGKAEGKAEGEAEALLRVLEHRGVPVSDGVRQRVVGCSDLDVLGRWFDRAFQVADGEELFAEDGE